MKPLQGRIRRLPLATHTASHLGYRIRQAVERAIRENRLGPLSPEVGSELADRLLSLNGKAASPSLVARRLQGNWIHVRDAAITRDPALDAYALDVSTPILHELVVDTEAVFASLKSLLDVADRLVRTVEQRVLDLLPLAETPSPQLLALPGLDANERRVVTDVRNQLLHESVPWFEVVLSENSHPDLMIVYSANPDYTSGKGYVLLSDLDSLIGGVKKYLDAVEDFLVNRIDRYGQVTGGSDAAAP